MSIIHKRFMFLQRMGCVNLLLLDFLKGGHAATQNRKWHQASSGNRLNTLA